jgi:hypothetical protein
MRPREEIVAELSESLAQLRVERARLDEEIARVEGAIAALDGHVVGRRHGGSTARAAVLATLATFDEPVHTTTLLDHELLTHYSRHTLRAAIGELHKAGQMKSVERTPRGFIWAPLKGAQK